MALGGRPPGSRREIKIIETSLRDGHQSLWATRMRTDHITSLMCDYDGSGFEQEKADVDAIMLKDAAGLLTPDRIRTLVPALKEVIGDRVLEVHTHSLTGLAPLVCLEAVEAGADAIHTSIWPLATANAQPSTQNVVRDLRALGYTVDIDLDRVDTISKKLVTIAETEGKPVGAPVEYNGVHYMHQIPGGMLANFRSQLATARSV